MPKLHSHQKAANAWVVDVNMGYGHSRAAYALRDLSAGTIFSVNDYPSIPNSDRKIWQQSRGVYEWISRAKNIPIVGSTLFALFDSWQKIPDFYPRRDLSEPNLQLKQIYRLIRKGFGKSFVELLRKNPLPLVTTFFIPAFMADAFDYPGDIYCVTTDADVSRSWAPLDPKRSRIRYIASNGRVAERLKLYGVRSESIFLTGFPLPKVCIGGPSSLVLKDALMQRFCHLDPNGIFLERYQHQITADFGAVRCAMKSHRPLTLLYSLGGAGAQRSIGVDLLESLRHRLLRKELRLVLMAGTRQDVARDYADAAAALGLASEIGKRLVIPAYKTRDAYFKGFETWLNETDILWTKPSELSFYTGLGLPIVMAPTIGSQEDFNKTWLFSVGGGLTQEDPKYADEWLFDWIHSGGLARMAWNGYTEAPTHGTYRIEDLVLGRSSEMHPLPLIV